MFAREMAGGVRMRRLAFVTRRSQTWRRQLYDIDWISGNPDVQLPESLLEQLLEPSEELPCANLVVHIDSHSNQIVPVFLSQV